MARPESIAVAGYYPTPPHLMERIAAILAPKKTGKEGDVEVSFVDPCAGEGNAVLALVEALCYQKTTDDRIRASTNGCVKLYTCEMEHGRHLALVGAVGRRSYDWTKWAVEGDAFRVTFKSGGAGILYLNPPYDTDPIHGRLEHKFLARFTDVLMVGGVVFFVVPHYALAASAEFLGREYEDVSCFRFPAADFGTYKQVVLFATRRESLFDPDPSVVAKIRAWATDPSSMPELPQVGDAPIASLPTSDRYSNGLDTTWQIRPVDIKTLIGKVRPWRYSTRGGTLTSVPGIIPDLPVQDLLLRQYPVATPPRPAHIAAGIASGLFNGARIEPADPSTKLPSLLVKGVFDREYRTIEEKQNADGEVRGLVQVQQPKLVTTVLDLTTHKYHQLKTGVEETGSLSVESMGVADLLKHYGASLMSVMERQCPILYDPRRDADSITLADSPRTMFTAQAHAARALVKLLGGPNLPRRARKGKAAILLGEIGSGKSTVSMMAARTIKARRVLILCPPHLLKSWQNEITAVCPDADARVLQTVTDVEDVASAKTDRMIIGILSREVAKLAHAWDGVGATCPACGQLTPKVDLAKTRARCTSQALFAADGLAQECMSFATWLANYLPNSLNVRNLLRGRFNQLRFEKMTEKKEQAKAAGKPWVFPGVPAGMLDNALGMLLEAYKTSADHESIERAIVLTLLTSGDNELILRTARELVGSVVYRATDFARMLVLMLPPDCSEQTSFVEEMRAKNTTSYYNQWGSFKDLVDRVKKGEDHIRVGSLKVSWKTGALVIDEKSPRSASAATAALGAIGKVSKFTWGEECGEFLFQAIPEPRRVALARHIVNYHPSLFDFMILDEGHEYATDGSAQERSAHRLTSLGIPTILMTGTIMNGYAESLFTNMWALSADFRGEFSRDERQRFIDRYGYRKRVVEDRDKETGKVVEFGTVSDRVTRCERVVGNAPGVLPLFLLRHLLPISVTLHKADLAIDLPPCKLERHMIEPTQELKRRYLRLQEALVRNIRKDMFDPERAGKLWGQLAEIPSYLDRATDDVGNVESGSYEIRYPESVGGALVDSQVGFTSDTLLPKEEWMLALVERELAEGRNVMVFSWHVALLPRIARLISERIGAPVPILHADKVGTAKRQDWIDREVVKKGRRVLVTNPVAIQTGLNNLIHFATELWMENPACNPVIYRQAIGRVDRIGQKLDTRIHFPIYEGTLQVQLYNLLAKKVAVSVSTDGLDPESALQAAGVGEDEYLAGLSIGKQLWAMLNEGVNSKAA